MVRQVPFWWSKAILYSNGFLVAFPRISFKFTCDFDFTYYPNDVQKCPLILFSRGTMDEVALNTDNTAPSFSTWDETSGNRQKKRHLAGWYLEQAEQYILYQNYMNGTNSREPPSGKAQERTAALYVLAVKLRRHAPYFGSLILLPAVLSSFATESAFWLNSKSQPIYVLLLSILLQGLSLQDLLYMIPPAVGTLPKIGNECLFLMPVIGWPSTYSFAF